MGLKREDYLLKEDDFKTIFNTAYQAKQSQLQEAITKDSRFNNFLEELKNLPIQILNPERMALLQTMQHWLQDPAELVYEYSKSQYHQFNDTINALFDKYDSGKLSQEEVEEIYRIQSLPGSPSFERELEYKIITCGECMHGQWINAVDQLVGKTFGKLELLDPPPEDIRHCYDGLWSKAETYLKENYGLEAKKPALKVHDTFLPNAFFNYENGFENADIRIPTVIGRCYPALQGILAHEIGHYIEKKLESAGYKQKLKGDMELKGKNSASRRKEKLADRYAGILCDPLDMVAGLEFLERLTTEFGVLRNLMNTHQISWTNTWDVYRNLGLDFSPISKEYAERMRYWENPDFPEWVSRFAKAYIESEWIDATDPTHPSNFTRRDRLYDQWRERIKEEMPHNPLGGIGRNGLN